MTCFSISNLTTGLLQLCANSFTGINACTAPESPQRCCSVGSWFGTTWTRDSGDVWTSLGTNCRENQVQTLPFGTPCSQWSCTILSPVANIPGCASLRSGTIWLFCIRDVSSERAFSIAAPRAWITWSPEPDHWHQAFQKETENCFVQFCISWYSTMKF